MPIVTVVLYFDSVHWIKVNDVLEAVSYFRQKEKNACCVEAPQKA
jgi:hypothetical protein